ncbi:MAG: thioredoxin domain-containing protein [Chloroflexota bacterium]
MARRKSPKQRKKERQQQKQRSQQTYIIIGVAAVAVLGAIIFALTSLPTEAPIPENIDQRYSNLMQSTTDEGFALLGNPNAPVTVAEYSSFSCPGCVDFHSNVFPQLRDDIENGTINFVYIPLQTGSVPNAEGAAKTAICAGEQGMFWEMHDVLFSWHETYGNSAFQDGRIRTGVQELGLDTGTFNRCFNSNNTNTILAAAIQQGVASTPTIQVNGATVAADLGAIEQAIQSNPIPPNLEPGTISVEDTDGDMTEDEEPMEEEPMDEATEEMSEDMEETAEPEMTEEADTDETDSEAEATEASE